jgi:hypothetical protein
MMFCCADTLPVFRVVCSLVCQLGTVRMLTPEFHFCHIRSSDEALVAFGVPHSLVSQLQCVTRRESSSSVNVEKMFP